MAGASAAVGMGPWATLYDWAEVSNPYSLTSAPYTSPGKVGVGTFVGFLAGCLLVSAALTGLATARIRGVALSQAGRPASRAGWRLPQLPRLEWLRSSGPARRSTATRWRGGSGTGRRPSRMMRVAWGMYAALGLLWVWMASRPQSGPAGNDGHRA